ncbi:GNAT family N-acetyltransferase [Methylobacterium sp. SyP6R]|uniref:GNAT family N-acetyltransferase n=1 Tax=Methylobacterium sp. SyP6R TaxID=2718876 RepID=UPI001F1CAB28|nr:GNAT family protein [Methylobacterium sp. SyP6R]MCF4123843.1 GNAT family N-acetyltransferase [Methylobacterium sp. SyP6R]
MSDPTLREIIEHQAATAHEAVVERLNPADDFVSGPGRVGQTVRDPLSVVSQWIQHGAGRALGHNPTWIRFVQPDRGAGLIVALSAPTPGGEEVDFVCVGDPGVTTRPVLRAACQWAFNVVGARRIVGRVPEEAAWLADYARRAGFTHEGQSRDYFGPGEDASVWAMTRHSCRWLPRPPMAIPTADTSPPSSTARH